MIVEFGHFRTADTAAAHALYQVSHACHQFIERELIAVVNRRRRQAAAANGDGHPGVDAGRWLKLPLLIKSVERWKTAGSQRDGFHSEGAHEQAAIGWPFRIEPGKELLASCYIDLMLKVVVRDFAFRPRHRRGDRGAHCVEIETD